VVLASIDEVQYWILQWITHVLTSAAYTMSNRSCSNTVLTRCVLTAMLSDVTLCWDYLHGRCKVRAICPPIMFLYASRKIAPHMKHRASRKEVFDLAAMQMTVGTVHSFHKRVMLFASMTTMFASMATMSTCI
jgi:hypothetical protein